MLTLAAIQFSSLHCGQRNLFRAGCNAFPYFSDDLKTFLNAEREDFVDLCFHDHILNLLARFEQAWVHRHNASAQPLPEAGATQERTL